VVWLQVDVTSKTEGKAFADATGVPLLVKYDTRIRDNVARGIVEDVTEGVQVGDTIRPSSLCSASYSDRTDSTGSRMGSFP
jgi:hypothetical protein